MNAAASIVGALGLIWLALLVLLVIWRLCNGREAAKAQASHVALDDMRDVSVKIDGKLIFQPLSDEVVVTQDGMFRKDANGLWSRFDEAA
jgi:hypothetical protein